MTTVAPTGTARAPSTGPAGSRAAAPTLRVERKLLRDGVVRLASVDEVGRGSPAGPAYVGVVVVDATVTRRLSGVRDSKLLTPEARQALVPSIRSWAVDWAVGSAGAPEVDRYGITAALRLAARRALRQLAMRPDLVLLDGSHDWLSGPAMEDPLSSVPLTPWTTPVVTRVKADLTCASVAAASVLAKVARDAVMVGLAESFPDYGWGENKGYATPGHLDALRRLGPSPHHRVSWRLPDQD